MAKNISSKKAAAKKTTAKQPTKKAAKKASSKKSSKTNSLLPIEVKLISSQTLRFVNGQEIAPNYEVKEGEEVTTKTIEHYVVVVGDKQQTQLADKTQCQAWADGIKEQQQNIYQMHLENGKTKAEAIKYTNQRYM